MDKEYFENRLNNLLRPVEEQKAKKVNLTKKNKEKLLSLKDKHKGERCFIIGSSPSLNQLDLTKLNNEYTFTVNRGYLLKEKGLKRSTYHIMPDPDTFKDSVKIDNELYDFADRYLVYAGINFPSDIKNVVYFDFSYNRRRLEQKFPEKITDMFMSRNTVIFYALQFAYHMGFSEVNIVGVDLDFNNFAGHSYKETEGEKARQLNSHEGVPFVLSGLLNLCNTLVKKGVIVQNASPVGQLNIKRVNYNSLFGGIVI